MLGRAVLSQLEARSVHAAYSGADGDVDEDGSMARAGRVSFVTADVANDLTAAMARSGIRHPRRKRLPVVEDDPAERLSIQELLDTTTPIS